jgi:hypothetical protein
VFFAWNLRNNRLSQPKEAPLPCLLQARTSPPQTVHLDATRVIGWPSSRYCASSVPFRFVVTSDTQEENSCIMCKKIKDFSDMCQNSCGHIYCLSCLRGLSFVRQPLPLPQPPFQQSWTTPPSPFPPPPCCYRFCFSRHLPKGNRFICSGISLCPLSSNRLELRLHGRAHHPPHRSILALGGVLARPCHSFVLQAMLSIWHSPRFRPPVRQPLSEELKLRSVLGVMKCT